MTPNTGIAGGVLLAIAALPAKWRKTASSGYPPLNDADSYTAATLRHCADELEATFNGAAQGDGGGECRHGNSKWRIDMRSGHCNDCGAELKPATPAGGGDASEYAPLTAEQCAQWLDAKYARHGEDDDRQAAAMIRHLASASPVAAGGGELPELPWLTIRAALSCDCYLSDDTYCNKCQTLSAIIVLDESRRLASAPAGVGDGVSLIAAERQRQITAEGWTPEHDDEHDNGEIACAAACYATPQNERCLLMHTQLPDLWPWGGGSPEESGWKPSPHDRIRELTKAGALIAAEIDRLQRAAAPTQEPQS